MSAIDGVWDSVSKSPMGDQKGIVTLKAEGDKLVGTSEAPTGKVDISEGVINGNDVQWVMNLTSPMPIKIEVSATVDGDTMTGKMKLGMFGEFPMTATRRAG
jgi:hypothetical protein